eukprot:gene56260-biopygen40159
MTSSGTSELLSGEPRPCFDEAKRYDSTMASVTATKPAARRSSQLVARKLAKNEIRSRLEQIELATVSSLRALQMDIDGDEGVSSTVVLKKAPESRLGGAFIDEYEAWEAKVKDFPLACPEIAPNI